MQAARVTESLRGNCYFLSREAIIAESVDEVTGNLTSTDRESGFWLAVNRFYDARLAF